MSQKLSICLTETGNRHYGDLLRERLASNADTAGCDLKILLLSDHAEPQFDEAETIDAFLISFDLFFRAGKSDETAARVVDISRRAGFTQAGSAGVDQHFLQDVSKYAKRYCTAAGLHAPPIAQYCVAQMLRWAKQIDRQIAKQTERQWSSEVDQALTGKVAGEVTDAVLGIYGVGGIGQELARLAKALGMEVIGLRRNQEPLPNVDTLVGPDQFAWMAERSDFLVSAAPHTPQTIGLFDRHIFQTMPNTGVFINVGRGSAVVQEDLVAALEGGEIAAAFLDTTTPEPLPADSPLWTTPNCLISPHNSAYSPKTVMRLFELFLDNIQRMQSGAPLHNLYQPN